MDHEPEPAILPALQIRTDDHHWRLVYDTGDDDQIEVIEEYFLTFADARSRAVALWPFDRYAPIGLVKGRLVLEERIFGEWAHRRGWSI